MQKKSGGKIQKYRLLASHRIFPIKRKHYGRNKTDWEADIIKSVLGYTKDYPYQKVDSY